MCNDTIDVLLITSDERFRQAARKQQLPSVTAQYIDLSELTDTPARELWVDLDGWETKPAVLPRAGRRVYFHAGEEPSNLGLPPGVFIRKPCTATVFQVLWAHAAQSADTEEHATGLSAWILDFHELSLAVLCRKLVRGLGPRLGYRDASLYLHDIGTGMLTLAETTHKRSIQLTMPLDASGQHLMAAVAQTGRYFQTAHAPEELQARGLTARNAGAYDDGECLIAPLSSEGQLWGVLNLSGRADNPLVEKNLSLDTLFAFIGRSLQHARTHDAARKEARIDSLTGLYNQRWMSESLEREIRRARRFKTPLTVLMADLDGLKTLNDDRGHAAGDCVLRHAAARITRVLRQFDSAARVGGDEFIIMLPGTNLQGARRVAQRLLDSVRRDPAHFRDVALPVTLSIGAAQWESGWNAEQLVEAADRAMYTAKEGGRNALVCTASLPSSTAGSNFVPSDTDTPR